MKQTSTFTHALGLSASASFLETYIKLLWGCKFRWKTGIINEYDVMI